MSKIQGPEIQGSGIQGQNTPREENDRMYVLCVCVCSDLGQPKTGWYWGFCENFVSII